MYKKRTSTKKDRKTPYKRRATNVDNRVPRNTSLSRWDTPFRTTMKYSDTVVLATSVGVGFTTYVLRPASLFDVDLTGTGHQPLRFDQMAAMFNNYRVRYSTVKANFSVGDVASVANALGPWRCTISKSRVNSTLPGIGSDPQTAAEMEGATTGVLTTQEQLNLYQRYHWTDCGVDEISRLTADVGGNPAIEFFWIISLYNQGNVAATNVLCNFDISFDVEFLNPKTIATS